MIRIIIMTCILLVSNTTYAQLLVNLSNATVLINENGHYSSTAFVINQDNDNYYLLATGHAIHLCSGGEDKGPFIDNENKVKLVDTSNVRLDATLGHDGTQLVFKDVVEILDYIYDGRPTHVLDDISLLKISKESIKDYKKPFHALKFSENPEDSKVGRLFWTAGHPGGGWLTLFKGKIIEEAKMPDAIGIFPPALKGRSGSPILNYSGQHVIGMIVYTRAEKLTNGQLGKNVSSGAIPVWEN